MFHRLKSVTPLPDYCLLAQFRCGGAQRHTHIGTRVAVGDREDVQLVDLLFVFFYYGGGADQHFLQRLTVNLCSQSGHQPFSRP